MRDLASRLREIVRRPVRELTYVPDLPAPSVDLDRVAAQLGGTRYDVAGSACIVIDRVWGASRWHGRRRLDAYAVDPAAPVALFDPRPPVHDDWASKVVFFDIETTGLSGGAGTVALLAGCGWFDGGRFLLRQFFLAGPAGERAMLDGIAGVLDGASLLVTYNGRTFDVPVMEMRWAFHRRDSGAGALPHLDMLPTARRLWGRPRMSRAGADAAPCSLASLERSVLRFHRPDDVPGIEIPSRYFQFLRTGDPALIEGVLDHNRHDIVSLAAITAHALRLAADGPQACERGSEQYGLGALYERAGDLDRADAAYRAAASSGDREAAAYAQARLAELCRRRGRHEEAALAWNGVLAASDACCLPPRMRDRAVEALAIHHEHRSRELLKAKAYAERLASTEASAHRLRRLDRKLGSRGRLL